MTLQLDINIYTGRHIQFHQLLDRFLVRSQDVDETLVRAGFELFAGIFVFVRASENRNDFLVSRERDRT